MIYTISGIFKALHLHYTALHKLLFCQACDKRHIHIYSNGLTTSKENFQQWLQTLIQLQIQSLPWKHVGITCLRPPSFCQKAFSVISSPHAPRPDVFPWSYTHGSFISGAQDVTNRREPMSFADKRTRATAAGTHLGKTGSPSWLERDRKGTSRARNFETAHVF